jgi:peptide/nickel transport system substrate-binding protein
VIHVTLDDAAVIGSTSPPRRSQGMHASRRASLLTSAVTALALAACGSSGGSGGSNPSEPPDDVTGVVNGTLPLDGPPQNGGTLTINDPSDAPTLDGMKSPSAYTHLAISGIVYSKLLEFEVGREIPYGSMGVRGDLADTWERSDDGLTWTFNLRDDVKWQNIAPVNGRAFTSADVACTVERIKTLPGVQKNLMDVVDTVQTPDDHTVVFQLNTPYAAFDETMASFYMEILPCEGTRGEFDLAQQAIGTGPFILQNWDRRVERTYVRNPDYFIEGEPHVDEVKVLIMSDPASTLAAFRAGQMDVFAPSDQSIESLLATNPDAVVRQQLGLTVNQIMFNAAREPFDDYRVRKAIAMAWDREDMGEAFYSNSIFALSGPFPSTLFGGMTPEDAKEAIPYDPEAAKNLLAEAGYPNGFSAEMLTTDAYGPPFVNQAQWVQQDLSKIGVNVTLKILDYATYYSIYQEQDYSIGWGLGTGFLTTDEWLQSLYTSDGPRNWFGTEDAKLDEMIAAQQSELDWDKREEQLHGINEYILENVLPEFIGMSLGGLSAQQAWVHNYYAHPQYARPHLADVWLDAGAPGRD